MTRGEDFIKKGKCEKNYGSIMSNSAWSDSNKYCSVLKLHDKSPDPKCNC